MTKLGRGTEVLDPYEWLPGYGETWVDIRTEGTELIVKVIYDEAAQTAERELIFSSVCSFYSQAFPGPSMLGLEGDDGALLVRGVLVEYPNSEAVKIWERHFGSSRTIRHYSIVFLAANILLVVLAGNVALKASTV